MLTGAVAEALTGVLTGFLTEVLTAEVFYPVGATLPKRVFLAGSAHGAQPCKNGSLGQVPPGPHSCKTLRQNLRQNPQNAVRVETDRSLPVDDQPAIVSEAKIPPPGLEPEPLG